MMMKKSLDNLRLNYVDLYLVHFPIGTNQMILFPLQKMEEQVDAGRTKAIGLSNFNQRQIERILKSARIKPACLQIEIHVAMQQKELVDFCHKHGIVVVAYSPLGSPNMIQNPVVKQIAEKHKKSTGQVMLRFLIQRDIVPIPKSVNPARIKQNFEVFDFKLDDEDMKKLGDLDIGESARVCDFKFFPP
nr:unnamed protein product [Callosobruchus analis]